LDFCSTDAERNAQFSSFMFQMWDNAPETFNMQTYNSTNGIHNDLKLKLGMLKITTSNTTTEYVGIDQTKFEGGRDPVSYSVTTGSVTIEAEFSEQYYIAQTSKKQVINTVFLMVILIIGVMSLNHDTTEHVVRPVQNMLKNVQKLAHDPFYIWDSPQMSLGSTNTKFVDANENDDEESEATDEEWQNLPPENEIHILQTTVMKISQLLALGFGRAGWNIIRNAVLKHNSSDTMSSGSKIRGIFLFTDIRGFTEVSECLGKNIIVFVNDVASVVHETTAEFSGATNKNIGDAFLAVWTFPGSVTVNGRSIKTCVHDENYEINGIIPKEISDMVNRALIATIKIQIRIYRSDKLNTYRVEKSIVSRYKHSFTVRLGCGLHVGWAVEGAIGTNHKIDATYLSPHVNISEILECKTKLYNVRFLITEQFVKLLPEKALHFVRPVDHVYFKEFKQNQDIFTVDLPRYFKYHSEKTRDQTTHNDSTIKDWRQSHTSSVNLYETDEDLLDIRAYQATISDFKEVYLEGFDAYRKGNWNFAMEAFQKALDLKPEDGPTCELLRYMKTLDGTPPENWHEIGRDWNA